VNYYCWLVVRSGVVSKSSSQVAQDGEDLGPKQHHGGVWSVRGDGTTLPAAPGEHSEVRQGRSRRIVRALAAK